jgi:hypothetical protein
MERQSVPCLYANGCHVGVETGAFVLTFRQDNQPLVSVALPFAIVKALVRLLDIYVKSYERDVRANEDKLVDINTEEQRIETKPPLGFVKPRPSNIEGA